MKLEDLIESEFSFQNFRDFSKIDMAGASEETIKKACKDTNFVLSAGKGVEYGILAVAEDEIRKAFGEDHLRRNTRWIGYNWRDDWFEQFSSEIVNNIASESFDISRFWSLERLSLAGQKIVAVQRRGYYNGECGSAHHCVSLPPDRLEPLLMNYMKGLSPWEASLLGNSMSDAQWERYKGPIVDVLISSPSPAARAFSKWSDERFEYQARRIFSAALQTEEPGVLLDAPPARVRRYFYGLMEEITQSSEKSFKAFNTGNLEVIREVGERLARVVSLDPKRSYSLGLREVESKLKRALIAEQLPSVTIGTRKYTAEDIAQKCSSDIKVWYDSISPRIVQIAAQGVAKDLNLVCKLGGAMLPIHVSKDPWPAQNFAIGLPYFLDSVLESEKHSAYALLGWKNIPVEAQQKLEAKTGITPEFREWYQSFNDKFTLLNIFSRVSSQKIVDTPTERLEEICSWAGFLRSTDLEATFITNIEELLSGGELYDAYSCGNKMVTFLSSSKSKEYIQWIKDTSLVQVVAISEEDMDIMFSATEFDKEATASSTPSHTLRRPHSDIFSDEINASLQQGSPTEVIRKMHAAWPVMRDSNMKRIYGKYLGEGKVGWLNFTKKDLDLITNAQRFYDNYHAEGHTRNIDVNVNPYNNAAEKGFIDEHTKTLARLYKRSENGYESSIYFCSRMDNWKSLLKIKRNDLHLLYAFCETLKPNVGEQFFLDIDKGDYQDYVTASNIFSCTTQAGRGIWKGVASHLTDKKLLAKFTREDAERAVPLMEVARSKGYENQFIGGVVINLERGTVGSYLSSIEDGLKLKEDAIGGDNYDRVFRT
jgi:hypothetical protein